MKNRVVIVTKNASTAELIRDYCSWSSDAPVLASPTENDVRGKIVIGSVSLSLAAEADAVLNVSFDDGASKPGFRLYRAVRLNRVLMEWVNEADDVVKPVYLLDGHPRELYKPFSLAERFGMVK